jgi:hypothetical protein
VPGTAFDPTGLGSPFRIPNLGCLILQRQSPRGWHSVSHAQGVCSAPESLGERLRRFALTLAVPPWATHPRPSGAFVTFFAKRGRLGSLSQ